MSASVPANAYQASELEPTPDCEHEWQRISTNYTATVKYQTMPFRMRDFNIAPSAHTYECKHCKARRVEAL